MKKILLLPLLILFFTCSITFAYTNGSLTVGGNKSGSFTIFTNDADQLLAAGFALQSGKVANVNVNAKVTYNNFQNLGDYVLKGGFNLNITSSGTIVKTSATGTATIILDGGPVYFGKTSLTFNKLRYNLSTSSDNQGCSSGSITIDGEPISCSQLNKRGVSGFLWFFLLFF